MHSDFVNTGEIGDAILETFEEYTSDSQEITFTDEQHAIWADLFAGIHQPHLLAHFCQEFLLGLELLQLDPCHIPTVAHLYRQIYPRSGWAVERTAVRYTNADDWYKKFARRIFLITDYLRDWEQIAFTPEPDMFHDIFGHLPYLTQRFYAAIEDKFAPAYQNATKIERAVIRRLAWYSTEFGLVMENNRIKVFGAGLISGKKELQTAIGEFDRLFAEEVIDPDQDSYNQLSDLFYANINTVDGLIAAINQLHQQGEMSSDDQGWHVMSRLYQELGVPQTGYFGGSVLVAPFDLDYIARIPKTVYAMNPIYFVFESFADLDSILNSYLKPIASRQQHKKA